MALLWKYRLYLLLIVIVDPSSFCIIGEKKYIICPGHQNFSEAEKNCLESNSELVKIKSYNAKERFLEFLKNTLPNIHKTNSLINDCTQYWVYNKEFYSNINWKYSKTPTHENKERNIATEKKYAIQRTGNNIGWVLLDSSVEMCWICEKNEDKKKSDANEDQTINSSYTPTIHSLPFTQAQHFNITELNTTDLTRILRNLKSSLQADNFSHLNTTLIKSLVDYLSSIPSKIQYHKIQVTPSILTYTAHCISIIVHKAFKSTKSRKVNGETRRQMNSLVKTITSLSRSVELNDSSFHVSTKSFTIDVIEHSEEYVYSPTYTVGNVTYNPVKITIPAVEDFSRKKRSIATTSRAAIILYKNDNLFQTNNNISKIVGFVLGKNSSTRQKLSASIEIKHHDMRNKYGQKALNKSVLDMKMIKRTEMDCVTWDYDEWSPDGCCLERNTIVPVCKCTIQDTFTLMVVAKEQPGPFTAVLFLVGGIFSIIGLCLTILIHLFNREVRKFRSSKILVHICVNLLVVYLLLLTGVAQTQDKATCDIVAVLIHYFQLVTWAWMAVNSFDMYNSIVKVFVQSKRQFLQRVSLLAYGIPFVIVTLTAGVTLGYVDQLNAHRFCDGTGDMFSLSSYRAKNACLVSGYSFYFTFLLPLTLMLLYNIFVFSSVIWERKRNNQRIRNRSTNRHFIRRQALLALVMASVMGFSWSFIYLTLISTNPKYLFCINCIFTSLIGFQGVSIFVMTTARRKNLRQVLCNAFRRFHRYGRHRITDRWSSINRTIPGSTRATSAASSTRSGQFSYPGTVTKSTNTTSHQL